jgi:hypothetical protein
MYEASSLHCRWEFALVVDPSQRETNYDQLDQRTEWCYEAIATSFAMITKTPGVGSIYLETYRDKDGDWFHGRRSYRSHIRPNPPMHVTECRLGEVHSPLDLIDTSHLGR